MQNGQEDSSNRLITLVHASDLHFGDLDPTNGHSDLSAGVPWWWALCPYFDGYLGHHASALYAFEQAFNDLRKYENAVLIVSGDLTANGADSQFKIAKNYLESTLHVGRHNPTGLQVPGVMSERTVPGNHDHWPGDESICGHPAALYSYFPRPPSLPINVQRIPLRNGVTLVLAGIDTSAEVNPYRANRFVARGHCVQQLTELQAAIPLKAGNDEIRVLILHHSPQMNGYRCTLTRSTKRVLKKTIEDYNINVLLTGHAHTVAGKVQTFTYDNQPRSVFEARCGTTLQRDTLPTPFIAQRFRWTNSKGLNKNTFLVHRLYEENVGITWETKIHMRMGPNFIDIGLIHDGTKNRNPIPPQRVL